VGAVLRGGDPVFLELLVDELGAAAVPPIHVWFIRGTRRQCACMSSSSRGGMILVSPSCCAAK